MKHTLLILLFYVQSFAASEIFIAQHSERFNPWLGPVLTNRVEQAVQQSAEEMCRKLGRSNTGVEKLDVTEFTAHYGDLLAVYYAPYYCHYEVKPQRECMRDSDCDPGDRCRIFFGEGPFYCVAKP